LLFYVLNVFTVT